MDSTAKAVRFLGWRMVAVAFVVDFVAVGFFFYSYGVFFKAIAAEFGGSRLGVSLGLTITSTVGALVAPLVGHALDRYPLKRVIGLGAVSMTLGFLTLGFVRSPLEFYLAIGVFIGFGASAMGSLASAKLVTNWFVKKRGAALGIAATGISVSGVVMPYVSAALIEAQGWREGFFLYAAFTGFVVVPLVTLLVISTPEEVGLKPDGQMGGLSSRGSTTPPAASPITTPITRERDFWVLVMVVGMLFSCSSATLTHMVPRLTDEGISLQSASLMMSLCAGFGIFGKLSFGWLADRWSGRTTIWFAIVCQIIGQAAMFQTDTSWLFAAGAAVFGYGMGGVVPLQGALVARIFGRRRFGKTMGSMRPAMLPFQVVGVPLAGWIFDTTGNYDAAIWVLMLMYVTSAFIVLGLQEQPAAEE